MEGQHAQTLWEAAILPALSGFLLCAAAVLFAAWRPASPLEPWRPLNRGRLARLFRGSVILVGAGYGAFLLIVLIYSEWLQHEPNGLETAWWSGVFLLGVAVPVWAGLTWFLDRRVRRKQGRHP